MDGGQGAVIVSPSGAELARYRKKQEKEKRQAEALQAYRAGPAVSARGQKVRAVRQYRRRGADRCGG